jgi:hypothetical protein
MSGSGDQGEDLVRQSTGNEPEQVGPARLVVDDEVVEPVDSSLVRDVGADAG